MSYINFDFANDWQVVVRVMWPADGLPQEVVDYPEKDTWMPRRRDIDERDIDRLLAALTDTQIAALYGMSEVEVYKLRRARRDGGQPPRSQVDGDGNSET